MTKYPIRMDRYEPIPGAVVRRLDDGRLGIMVAWVGTRSTPVVAIPRDRYFEEETELDEPSIDLLELVEVEDQTGWIVESEGTNDIDIFDDSEQ